MSNKPLDRRRKYYLVLDCETATLPCASKYNGEQKKSIAISKPLIYDLGWQIIDAKGNVYRRQSYLISEIFSVPSIFNTAYYASKRPLYLEKIRTGAIKVVSWAEATQAMLNDMALTQAVGAYNAMFDFKKAITFTEEYINHLYSDDFFEWEAEQNRIADFIATATKRTNKAEKKVNPHSFDFRNVNYPLFDIWGLTCENLLNNDEYRAFCDNNKYTTKSGKYYPTTAEIAYRFLTNAVDFEESHTAIEDTEIECQLLTEIFKKVKPKDMTMGIIYFPYRLVGRADI